MTHEQAPVVKMTDAQAANFATHALNEALVSPLQRPLPESGPLEFGGNGTLRQLLGALREPYQPKQEFYK